MSDLPSEHAADFLVQSADLPWVPQGSNNVWFKPIRINLEKGTWVNLLKVAKSGVVNRHRHVAEVEGWVLQGKWRYIEHDWQASPGAYVYEPPGGRHAGGRRRGRVGADAHAVLHPRK